MHIGPGTGEIAPVLRDIERAAGRAFRDLGMDAIADDEPPAAEDLHRYAGSGRLWVASDERDGRAVAYAMVDPVDGSTHIEQISVHPDSARRGVGRALIEHIAASAAAEGVPALTLCTFLEVPWNAPYYARCGFRLLEDRELTPGLRRLREHEGELGLDRWPRSCMRRDLV